MPTVSIIVPVYMVEKYISDCVASLTSQTLKDIEIILIDDGSPDQSGKLCDELAKEDARIHVIHQTNQGVSVARNAGLSYASGKWITFIDGDDWASPKLCEESVKCGEANDADVVIFSYVSVYKNKQVPSKLLEFSTGDITDRKDYIIKKTISQYYGGTIANNGVSAGTTWGKLIKKKVIDKYSLTFKKGLTRAQDTVFWLRGFEYSERIMMCDMPLYYYRITDDSICSSTKYIPNCEIPFSSLLDEYQKYIDEFQKDNEYYKALYLRTMQVMLWYLKHNYFHTSSSLDQKERIKQFKLLCNKNPFSRAIRSVNVAWAPRGIKVLTIFTRLRAYKMYYFIFKKMYDQKDRTIG